MLPYNGAMRLALGNKLEVKKIIEIILTKLCI